MLKAGVDILLLLFEGLCCVNIISFCNSFCLSYSDLAKFKFALVEKYSCWVCKNSEFSSVARAWPLFTNCPSITGISITIPPTRTLTCALFWGGNSNLPFTFKDVLRFRNDILSISIPIALIWSSVSLISTGDFWIGSVTLIFLFVNSFIIAREQ